MYEPRTSNGGDTYAGLHEFEPLTSQLLSRGALMEVALSILDLVDLS
jgi:hypothetical protein